MQFISNFFALIISLYFYIVIAWVISTWLINFNIISLQSSSLSGVFRRLEGIVEPALDPIRKGLRKIGMDNLGGVDISPVVLILCLIIIRKMMLDLSH